ncbi:MAG: fructosamine kinase family protein [Bacteroidota bacterium]
MNHDFLNRILKESLGSEVDVTEFKTLGGGCINNAMKLETSHGPFFIKVNKNVPDDFFPIEEQSLDFLDKYYPGSVPKPISSGSNFLLTEFIESGAKRTDYWKSLGENLAELHQESNSHFGLNFSNYIGSLNQSNQQHESWIEFFIHERLGKQISLAKEKDLGDQASWKSFEKLIPKLESLIPEEKPALIHGDLWSGNLMVDSNGLPALIDPAIYFGHREMDLAFTQLFGGFDRTYLDVYNENYPLEPGFYERIDLHNLYPLLVHLNLFGNSYLGQIKGILSRFI